MIKVETFQNFRGFGSGGMPGEYYYSQGMNRSRFGIAPGWKVSASIDNGTLSGLGIVQWFSQGKFGSSTYVLAVDDNNKLYKSLSGIGTWALANTPATSGAGNGMIVDQKNRVLYAQTRYLGMSSDLSSFTDNWKDFGASISPTNELRPMETFEDWVLIGNSNKVALLNVTDDSFNTEGFTFPEGYVVRAIKSGRAGVLLGSNFNNQGVLALWDAQATRSIAPWIWLNANIKSIKAYANGWLVLTTRAIYWTNGYTIEPFIDRFFDTTVNQNSITQNLLPQGAEIVGEYLAFWGASSFSRTKHGMYLLNLQTKTFEFTPVANGALYGVTGGAIFFDSNFTNHLSYNTDLPSKYVLGRLLNNSPTSAYLLIESGQGDNEKAAEAVKLNLGFQSRQIEDDNITFNVTVKLYNFKRILWAHSQTNAASSAGNKIRVNGTVFKTPKVGDEVTVLHGANAGLMGHITSIANSGTNTEEWTLDTTFSNNTEDTIQLSVTPFQKVSKQTISDVNELKDLFFNVKNKVKGKRFLIKILFENLNDAVPEMMGGTFIYDDKGSLTSN